MKLTELKSKVIKKVSEAETRTAIDILINNLHPQSEKTNQAILLLSRLNALIGQKIKGTLPDSEIFLENNKINESILSLNQAISNQDLKPYEEPGNVKDLEIAEILKVINSNFEEDLKVLEGKWNLDSVVNKNTILIVIGGHVYSELLDRVSGYLLQRKINEIGDLNNKERAIIIGDLQYQQALILDSTFKESIAKELSVISIGSPSINEVTSEIILKKSTHVYEDGANIAFQIDGNIEKVALWGLAAVKTSESVEKFINKKENGLKNYLNRVWKKK